MKCLLSLLLFTSLYSLPAFSQNDTSYLYFDKSWQECNKDTASYYGIVYKTKMIYGAEKIFG